MHLASINSAEEQKDLQDHIQAYGESNKHTIMKFQALNNTKKIIEMVFCYQNSTVRKKCSSDREKLLKFEGEG